MFIVQGGTTLRIRAVVGVLLVLQPCDQRCSPPLCPLLRVTSRPLLVVLRPPLLLRPPERVLCPATPAEYSAAINVATEVHVNVAVTALHLDGLNADPFHKRRPRHCRRGLALAAVVNGAVRVVSRGLQSGSVRLQLLVLCRPNCVPRLRKLLALGCGLLSGRSALFLQLVGMGLGLRVGTGLGLGAAR